MRLVFSVCFLIFSTCLFAQEETEKPFMPYQKPLETTYTYFNAPSLSTIYAWHNYGSFVMSNPYEVNLLPAKETIDIMSIAQERRRERQANIIQLNEPTKQMRDIESSVKVFQENRNFSYRTEGTSKYDKRTPDGGIRNEVFEDVSQPVINPYYHYSPYYYGRPSNRSSGFYFMR